MDDVTSFPPQRSQKEFFKPRRPNGQLQQQQAGERGLFDLLSFSFSSWNPGNMHKQALCCRDTGTRRRMNCLPDPPEPEVTFDKDVPSEVLKVLSTAKNGKDLGAKEKFEKIADKKKPKNKKQNKQNPQQLAAKQHAAQSENSIISPTRWPQKPTAFCRRVNLKWIDKG